MVSFDPPQSVLREGEWPPVREHEIYDGIRSYIGGTCSHAIEDLQTLEERIDELRILRKFFSIRDGKKILRTRGRFLVNCDITVPSNLRRNIEATLTLDGELSSYSFLYFSESSDAVSNLETENMRKKLQACYDTAPADKKKNEETYDLGNLVFDVQRRDIRLIAQVIQNGTREICGIIASNLREIPITVKNQTMLFDCVTDLDYMEASVPDSGTRYQKLTLASVHSAIKRLDHGIGLGDTRTLPDVLAPLLKETVAQSFANGARITYIQVNNADQRLIHACKQLGFVFAMNVFGEIAILEDKDLSNFAIMYTTRTIYNGTQE